MTDRGPVLIAPGTGVPSVYKGWNGVRFMMSAALSEHLQIAHLFGSAFHSVFPASAGVADKSIGDHSWNGRHATNVGPVVPAAKHFTSGSNAYYLSSLTLNQIIALGTGNFTLVGVANLRNTAAALMGAWNSDANDGVLIGRDLSTSTRYQARISFANGSHADQIVPVIATDGYTGTGYEFIAFVADNGGLTATLCRRKPGGSLQPSSAAIPAPIAGAQRICWGRSYPASNYTAASDISLGMAFSKALSTDEIASLYGTLQPFLAASPYLITT